MKASDENRRGGPDREKKQRKTRGTSGRAGRPYWDDAQEGSDKSVHGEVATRMGLERDRTQASSGR
jgi:hypothetical protein